MLNIPKSIYPHPVIAALNSGSIDAVIPEQVSMRLL